MSSAGLSLKGKVAVVTGAKRGIGRAVALTFVRAGADVAICTRNPDSEFEETASELKRLGGRFLAMKADVTLKSDVDNFVNAVIREFGKIDVLVNNAAWGFLLPLLDLKEDGWDGVIDTNLKGYFLMSQAVGRHMVSRREGNIINMSSFLAFKAWAGLGAYCVSKAGIVMLTRVLALELGKYNIRVNAIAPGMIQTEFSRPIWGSPEFNIPKEIPLGRLGTSEDVASVALFLASGASGYVSGETVTIDGGELA